MADRPAGYELPVSHWDLNGWPRQTMSKFWSSVLPYSVASFILSSAPVLSAYLLILQIVTLLYYLDVVVC